MRNRGAAWDGDDLYVDVVRSVSARGGDEARFGTGPERPDPVADQAVKWMVVCIRRGCPDAVRGCVVLDRDTRGIVTVVCVRDDG